MKNPNNRTLQRIAGCLFLLSLIVVAVQQFPTVANSQALLRQRPGHVDRELKNFEGRLILSSFFRGSAFPQAAPGEKTVEQVQKNIQILKGLPASQLQPLMNYISTSLGVRCDFCHVNKDGDWNFALDEKPHKATAREMMQMVLSVNKTTFKGTTEVTCYTCHRGRSHPTGMPFPLPAVTDVPAASPAATAETDAAKPKETPPTADQVLDKYLTALGGAEAVAKLKTRWMKGTLITSNGTLGYELQQSAPDQLLATLVTPRQVTIERGFDGVTGWEKTPRGVRTVEGTELFYLRRYPGLFQDLKLKEQFTRLTFAGTDKINDREVYVLRGASADNKRERLYFDRETGLLVRRVITTPTMLANIPEQIDFEDYREVEGMKLPFTIRITSIDPFYSTTRKFTEIKLNVPVDAAKFVKPAAAPAATP